MKVLAIIQCSYLGGMEKVTLDSLSLLKEKGHEVRLFSLHPVGDLIWLTNQQGIQLDGTKAYKLYGLGNIPEILRAICQFQPDRIWLIGHNFGSLVAAKLSGRPTSLSLHYHHTERPMRFLKLFYYAVKLWCSRIHFVSRYIYIEVAHLFKNSDRIICYPNMLRVTETPILKSIAQEKLGLPADAFVIGNAGELIERKAFDVFLKTAAIVRQKIPNAVFVIAGDGSEREKLERLAESLGLSNAVWFLGWQTDVEPFYAALDLLLFNSNFDCLPTTPLEAMVREIPVVCSLTHGGLKEVFRHGKDGFLLDSHDCGALANEIIRLYNNPAERAEIAKTGRLRVKDVCSPEKHLMNLNNLLQLT